MGRTHLIVSATSLEEARDQAVSELGVPADDMTVIALDDGRYRAELVNHDADVEVEISPDKSFVTIAAYIPARGTGRPMTPVDLVTRLKDFGVVILPSAETADRLTDLMRQGKDVTGTIVVRATLPRPARDAAVHPLGDWNYPVFPGDVMGRYSPPRPARDGLAVTGEAISAENIHAPENLIFAKDSGCRLDPETSEVVAERYGLAEVQDRRPMVAPLVAVANRKMTVKATVYARTAGGEPTTPDHFRRLLEGFGVTASLQEEALEQALEQAGNSGSPVEEVVLARGVLPRNGRHGAFKPEIVSTAESSPGQETDDGRIDYRARGRIRSVRPGDLLGRLIPPEPGVPGLDVFGDLVPAKDGKPFKLTAGENVEVSEDGTEYTSTSEGMVFFVGHTLKVSEVFEINGDVDLAVGNVLLERGSVRITGSVMTGFRVEAPGNVVIGKVVEGATIVAGGDVQVGYGIVGGQLEVGGRISAMYAQNAIMHAHGDVEIAHEINNCTIFTGGKVVATQGRGKVVGGVLNCNEGVMAKEIGSPIGVETFIFLAVDRKAEANLATKKQLEENLKKIYAVVGAGDIKTALEKSPPDKREAVAKVLKARLQCEQELREVEAEIERDREARLTPLNIKVKATVGIHPDVVITCFKAQFRSTTFMSSPTIVYSVAERKLVVA